MTCEPSRDGCATLALENITGATAVCYHMAMQTKFYALSGLLPLFCAVLLLAGCKTAPVGRPWCSIFSVNKAALTDVGKSRFFLLWPGYMMKLQHGQDTLIISVLDETKMVDGVKTRVVEERETKDGKLIEVSRNYFAISKQTGDVYYFGEDVDINKNGKVVDHEGSWLAGVKGAKFGLMMPGRPEVGDRYCQEVAPGVAMDRVEILGCHEKCTTPENKFEDCVRAEETSALEKGSSEKIYAPGVGLIKDGNFLLTALNCPICNGKPEVPTYPAW